MQLVVSPNIPLACWTRVGFIVALTGSRRARGSHVQQKPNPEATLISVVDSGYVVTRQKRAGMVFIGASRIAGDAAIGQRWHSLAFGLSASIVSEVLMSTQYSWTTWHLHGRTITKPCLTPSSHRSISLIITFWNLHCTMLIYFSSVSLSIYFNTPLTPAWLYWYPTTTLSDPKIRQEDSWLEQCCYVCRLKSSVVQRSSYPKSVGWHTLKISCPCPCLCVSAPPTPDPSHNSGRGRDTG